MPAVVLLVVTAGSALEGTRTPPGGKKDRDNNRQRARDPHGQPSAVGTSEVGPLHGITAPRAAKAAPFSRPRDGRRFFLPLGCSPAE